MGTGNPKTMSGWQSLMEEAPGFVKGGGGTKIYRRRVRPEDLSCQYCLYAKGRKVSAKYWYEKSTSALQTAPRSRLEGAFFLRIFAP